MIEQQSTEDSVSRDGLEQLRFWRDAALACLILSVVLSLAIMVRNFGPVSRSLVQAQALIAEHRTLLANAEAVLQRNQQVLRENQIALENVKKAVAAQHR